MAKNTMTAEQKVHKALNLLITDYPFFATLALQLKIAEEKNQPTMCTDGHRIMYNPSFVDRLPLGEVCFVLIHEVMHDALGHLWRRDDRDFELWNFATDFVVNATIKKAAEAYYENNSRVFGSMALEITMPKECLYNKDFENKSAEEVYSILKQKAKKNKNGKGSGKNGKNGKGQGNGGSGSGNQQSNQNNGGGGGNGQDNQSGGSSITYDGKTYQAPQNHKSWEKEDKSSTSHKNEQKIKWDGKFLSASEMAKSCGTGVAGIERAINKIKNPQKDWRTLLQEFIQEEFNDYSLMPPDKRYDSDFFMFDFNDTVEVVNDILFFVDTSGSMGSKELNMCFSEIQGAINQFKNHLHGKLLFFDYDVDSHVYDFDDVDGDISELAAFGGGGTSYKCIFDYINHHQEDFNNINGVVILTDGYCDYPKENVAEGLPVLWIFTTKDNKPPFGRSAELNPEDFDEAD